MKKNQMGGEHGLVAAMLKLIEDDRNGTQISTGLIKTVTNSMGELSRVLALTWLCSSP